MLSPVDVKNLSQIRYAEMLEEAAVARRIQRPQVTKVKIGGKLGNLLIRIGQRLEAKPVAKVNSSI